MVDSTSVLLDWNSVGSWGTNCGGNNNRYLVYLEAGDTTPDVQVANYGSGTTQHSASVSAGSTYYWMIRASNGALSTDSATRSFRVCSRNDPTVQLVPPVVTGRPNEQKTYRVDVTNNDGSSCGSSTFALSATGEACSGGWTCGFNSSQIDVGPGGTGSATFYVRPPLLNVALRSYKFTVLAVNLDA